MSRTILRRMLGRMRRRRVLIVLASCLPLIGGLLFAMRGLPVLPWIAAALAGMLLIVAGWTWRTLATLDAEVIVRGLDQAMLSLDDSSDLLLHEQRELSALEHLQRQRVLDRLGQSGVPDLRDRWPWLRIGVLAATAVAVALASFVELDRPEVKTLAQPPSAEQVPVATATELSSIRVEVQPPAYTGLPDRAETSLDVEAAQGASLRWTLAFAPQPQSASLRFHDGSDIELNRVGEVWIGAMSLSQSILYRVEVTGSPPLADDRLHRLDAIADQPPVIRVIAPEKTLSLVEPGQSTWLLEFEVSDDYGIADASLAITLAQGSGEQVTVSERSERLQAEKGGSSRNKRYRRALPLASSGITAGDDLIVRLGVGDLREPRANTAHSASFILRWPAEMATESEGVEGIVQKALPAYFRSQRQIIIDTEALLAERASLGADEFLSRSDTIGVDQKILRLRYGQFLGEEFESGGGAGPEHREDEGESHAGEATQQDALPAGHSHDDGHDHGNENAGFGIADDVLAEYGHAHDHAEAATLLDPETKKILKSALAEMWQSELHLRMGEPAKALPFENRALGFIKQVQQASRIYLARVGLELPPVDESRRLSGERKDLRDRSGILVAADAGDEVPKETYLALSRGEPVEFDVLNAWLRDHESSQYDTLGLIAALDALKREPACEACRESVLDALWPLLAAPPASTSLRVAPDEAGKIYLDGLGREVQP